MLRLSLRRDRLEARVAVLYRVAEDLGTASEIAVLQDHLHRHREAELGLLFVAARAVEFGAWFAVAEEHVQRQRRAEHRLAVLACDVDQRLTIPARSIWSLPAEQVRDDRLLPVLELDQRAGQFALHMPQILLDEVDRTLRLGVIEHAVASRLDRVVSGDQADDAVEMFVRVDDGHQPPRKKRSPPSMTAGGFVSVPGSGVGAGVVVRLMVDVYAAVTSTRDRETGVRPN